MKDHPPHLVGDALLKAYGFKTGSALAHAFSCVDYESLAKVYGKVGGYAHLATLIKRLRASRPASILLDGGDSWQGSGSSLWTHGQDMVEAALLLGVEAMTMHWECTYGQDRVKEVASKDFAGKIEIIAQNIKTADFGDQVFKPYVMRDVGGVKVAVIGQAFPYTPIAHPRFMMPDWTFGIQEESLQVAVDDARAHGAVVAVLLSHNGMDVDLKLASRIRGLDAILGGHTHDGVPRPVIVANPGGRTLVTNAGSNGKFVGVLDFAVASGKVSEFRYKLMPVFSNLLPADKDMASLITRVRAPFEDKLSEKLATSDGLLYRRGNFSGSVDQVILDALLAEKNAEIALSPGFRWGTTILPGEAITMEHVLDQTAITYPTVTLTPMTGATLKTVLEDVADNLFNPDPYYQQGGDMVRVGGMTYAIDPTALVGKRISDMRLNGELIDASKTYKVAGWASVSQAVHDAGGQAIWDLIATHLRGRKRIAPPKISMPALKGVAGNQGITT